MEATSVLEATNMRFFFVKNWSIDSGNSQCMSQCILGPKGHIFSLHDNELTVFMLSSSDINCSHSIVKEEI